MKMPTIIGIFIFITEKFSCSAMFSKKEVAIVSNLRVIRGQISYLAELSMKNVL